MNTAIFCFSVWTKYTCRNVFIWLIYPYVSGSVHCHHCGSHMISTVAAKPNLTPLYRSFDLSRNVLEPRPRLWRKRVELLVKNESLFDKRIRIKFQYITRYHAIHTHTHIYVYIYIYIVYMWHMSSVFSHESAQRNDAGHLICENVYKTKKYIYRGSITAKSRFPFSQFYRTTYV